eukprot:4541517-Pleurochrysis_carterae.AAC.3
MHWSSLLGKAYAHLRLKLATASSAPLRKPLYYAPRQQPKIKRRNCAIPIFKFVTVSITLMGFDLNQDPPRYYAISPGDRGNNGFRNTQRWRVILRDGSRGNPSETAALSFVHRTTETKFGVQMFERSTRGRRLIRASARCERAVVNWTTNCPARVSGTLCSGLPNRTSPGLSFRIFGFLPKFQFGQRYLVRISFVLPALWPAARMTATDPPSISVWLVKAVETDAAHFL